MGRVKIAVIGIGGWGKRVTQVLSELENCELTAVCDVDKDRVGAISKAYGVQGFTDSSSLFKKTRELEAVAIVTPTPTHYEMAVHAIEAGKHVFVEKPMCDSVNRAKKLVKVARERKIKLMVGYIERFNPAVQELKKLIEAGKVGRPIVLSARRVGRPVKVSEVGVIRDLAVHDIDVMRFLIGEPKAVFARCGTVGKHPFEDHAEIMIIFNEVEGFIEVNWLTLKKERSLTVTGNLAVATVDYLNRSLTVKHLDKTVIPEFTREEPLRLELASFANCILYNKEPPVSGIDGLRALEVADAALKSAKTGRIVKLC